MDEELAVGPHAGLKWRQKVGWVLSSVGKRPRHADSMEEEGVKALQ